MYESDYSIPHFITRIQGTHMVVTLDLISKVLHVLRVEFAKYPSCERLRTVSKDKLSSRFCETPSSWGNHQNTPCSSFAKGPRFLNMVMTFVLHPLSHYNFIIVPRARFLLSFLEGLIIDFPSHFILSLIDVNRDTATRDKLIFPSAITQILYHFSVSYPESTHFFVMCAINATSVKWNEAQLRPKQPRTETTTPLASSAPSSSAPFAFVGGVTFEVVMVQPQGMNARLYTLTTELYQVNTCVDRIAQRQARLGGFVESPTPSLETFEDEDDGGDSGGMSDGDETSSSSTNEEMTASQ